MVIGVGLDLVQVEFWRRALNTPGTSVVEGTFTAGEISTARRGPGSASERLAARFAAKEAFVKALGGGRIGAAPLQNQLDLREIEIKSDAFGRPSIDLSGQANRLAERLGVERIWLSMSHDGGIAAATVILEGG